MTTNARALGLLLWLKWTLMWRAYRRDRLALIGIIFTVLITLPLSLGFGIGSAVLLARLDAAQAGTLLTLGLISTYAMWIIGPVVGFAFNESYDISKLFGYPLSMRQIFAGALLGALIDIPILFFAPSLFGVVFGFARNAVAIVFTPLVLIIFLVHVVSLSQTVMLLTSGFLSSRRFRDSMTVVMPLFGMSVYFFSQYVSRRMVRDGDWTWLLNGQLPPITRYLPPGMAAQAIAQAAQAHWVSALLWLVALVAVSVATLYGASWAVGLAWSGEVGRLSAQPGARALPKAKAARPTLLGDSGLPSVMKAIMAKELAYVRRDPYYKLLLVNGLYFIGVMAFAFWREGDRLLELGPRLLWFTPVLHLFSMQVLNNLYGVEGGAASILFGSPSPRRTLILAKNLVFGLLFGGLALLVTLAGGLALGAGRQLPVYLLWVALVLVILTAAGNIVSIYLPYRVVLRGWRMRASLANRGCGYLFLYFGVLLGTVVLILPVFVGLWLPPRFGVPSFGLLGLAFSIGYAALLYLASLWVAGRLLQAREPEILEKLTEDPNLG